MTGVLPSTMRLAHLSLNFIFAWPERTLIQSCFPCKRSTQLSPSWRPRVADNRIALLSNSFEKVIPALSKGIKRINNGFGRDTTCFSHPPEEFPERSNIRLDAGDGSPHRFTRKPAHFCAGSFTPYLLHPPVSLNVTTSLKSCSASSVS